MSTESAPQTDDSVHAEWDRPILWARVHDWQADDVIAGKVSDGALRLWLVLCRYSRKLDRLVYPSSRKLMESLKVGDRYLRELFCELKAAGWVTVKVEESERFYGGRRRVTTLHEARASGPGDSGTPSEPAPNPPADAPPNPPEAVPPHSYPEEIGGDGKRKEKEGLPAQSPPLEISQDKAPVKRKAPDWIVALGSELREIYPHGIKESGELRKPTPKVTTERLRIALSKPDGKIKDDAEDIAAEMVRVAKLLASVPRTLEDRKFMQSLEVWINQAGWENPPEVGPKPRAPLQRGELTDAPTHHWNYKRLADERTAADEVRAKSIAREKRDARIKAGTATPEEVGAQRAENEAHAASIARVKARGGPVYSYPDPSRKTESTS